jgi:hypothetical protein
LGDGIEVRKQDVKRERERRTNAAFCYVDFDALVLLVSLLEGE